jgi:DNA-binding NarL/FixJ family response regulator
VPTRFPATSVYQLEAGSGAARQAVEIATAERGRKPKLTKHQQTEALARMAQGETLTEIAKSYNVSHITISRLAGVAFMQ